jgi:hypothetical protein
MIHYTTPPLQAQLLATVNRLQCLVCHARHIGENLICPPRCPSCGHNALALVETLSLDDPWWHLLQQVEVA